MKTRKQTVEFVASVPLDLMNSLYFTHLAGDVEGVDGWPQQARTAMAPALLAELDFLYTFPKGQPGLMGTLGDGLFSHRQTWRDVDSLVHFVRHLPLGVGEWPMRPGVQGLAFCSTQSYLDCTERTAKPPADVREELRGTLNEEDIDVDGVLAVRPARGASRRMARLIEQFYEQHFREDLPRRLPCLERSVAAHQGTQGPDMVDLICRLTGRDEACCQEEIRRGDYDVFIFAPSIDMGPYISCGVVGRIHGLFYPCEAQFTGETPQEAPEDVRRLARLYKALSDEQRLRILQLLRGGEMYAQEIVERTGLNQPVVSRHLTFMSAVGLVSARRQNNMKFFAINPSVREEIQKTLELLATGEKEATRGPGRTGGR
jgi:ArsR family transcriptional regulator